MAYKGFLREHGSISAALYAVVDLAMIVAGAFGAYAWRFGAVDMDPHYRAPIFIVVLLSAIIFPALGLYDSWRGRYLLDQVRALSLGWAGAMLGLVLIGFFLKESAHYSRLWIGVWTTLSWLLLNLGRTAASLALRWLRVRGWNRRRIFMIGDGPVAQDVATRVCGNPSSGWQIVAAASTAPTATKALRGVRIVPYRPALERLVRRLDIDEVWICLPLHEQTRIEQVLWDLRHSTATLRLVPSLHGLRLIQHPLAEVLGMPMLNLSVSPMQGLNRLIKTLEDKILATLILIPILPILAIVAIAIRCTSRGPILYKQPRHGSDGRVFEVLKFRTMREDADTPNIVVQAKRDDPRVTLVGKFLRRTSLDELPQIFNVLKGEMSIVGPRPHAISHNEQYKEKISAYMQRHKVKPGITGWAQVNGWRGETDTLEKMQKRIECDLYYIDNWSLWLDLKIIMITLFKGFINKNAY